MSRRVLSESAEIRSATEMGWGSYNTAFRIELADGPPVVLRVAPGPGSQARSERQWLRSEYAANGMARGPRVTGPASARG
jgi:hypothetical protein